MNKKHFIIALIMVLAAFSRLIPHPPNFAPITAIALFSGFYVTNKFLVYALPIGIMILSDLFINFFEKYGMKPKKLSLSIRNKYFKSIKNFMKINASSYELEENTNRTFVM